MNASQESPHDEGLLALAQLLSGLVERMGKRFMEGLEEAKSEGLLGRLRSDAAVRARFEIHAHAVLFTDVTAVARQTPEVRKRLYEATTSEMFRSLNNLVPDYDESVFNRELNERMVQYAGVMNEPQTVFPVPQEVRIWETQQANLTKAVCKKWLFSNRKKETDVVSIVYRDSCGEKEQAMRLLVTNLLSASDDLGRMSEDDYERIINETQQAIIKRFGL